MNVIDVSKLAEFDNQALVVKIDEPSVGLKGFIAFDKINDNFPALGATRLWNYSYEEDAINDALRLAKLMGKKSAMADLPYTGAKAVLMYPDKGIKDRKEFFKVYAQRVNELSGKFITGTDVGLTDDDLQVMANNSAFIIGLGVPAAYYTALGVLSAIKVSLEQKFGTGEIKGHSFAIQGLGKTGYELLKLLYAAGGTVIVSDINQTLVEKACKDFPLIKKVSPEKIHGQAVDVFCPCAMSHAVNNITTPELRCEMIVGSANNQLADSSVGEKLHQLGILYAPDYITNGGGLISVVDQFEHGTHDERRILEKLSKLSDKLRGIYVACKKENLGASIIANSIVSNFTYSK